VAVKRLLVYCAGLNETIVNSLMKANNGFAEIRIRKLLLAALAIVFLGVWMPPNMVRCRAQGTIYSSRSAFNAALGSATTITFDGVTPIDPSGNGVSSVTASGVTFTNAGSRLFVGPFASPTNGPILWNFDSSTPVGIILPGGLTGFGADFSGGITPQPSFNGTLTVNLFGGQSYAYNFSALTGSWVFFGATFSQPIASLVYDDGGLALPGSHEEMLDNVTFGTAVPEPSFPSLIALGFIVGLFCHRRNGRSFLRASHKGAT
jgi:hypothetical protein